MNLTPCLSCSLAIISRRSKYLFSCNSVTIAHKLEWTQHFHAALDSNPQSINQNFIELPGKLFENLELGVRELWKSDGIQTPFTSSIDSSSYKVLGKNSAKQIADSASRILRDRYLTPTATSCYMRAALRFYSDVMVHSTWGSDGVTLEKGNGVKPDSGRGKDLKGMGVVGDVEYGVWTLVSFSKLKMIAILKEVIDFDGSFSFLAFLSLFLPFQSWEVQSGIPEKVK